MRSEEIKQLGARLTQLAEAFDRKAPTPGALLVWMDVLKEFSIMEVESMLVDMPKRLTKFPSPADVWKACNERRSERIENEARAHRLDIPPRIAQLQTNTPTARAAMLRIKDGLSHPRPSKRDWIDKIICRHEDGDEKLSGYALKLAKEAQSIFARRSA